LQTVYRLTSAKLFGVALRILGESSEAEDVLQEVYLGHRGYGSRPSQMLGRDGSRRYPLTPR
jgi:DNA-directed RNA polymerase specialized sigma24 family protein